MEITSLREIECTGNDKLPKEQHLGPHKGLQLWLLLKFPKALDEEVHSPRNLSVPHYHYFHSLGGPAFCQFDSSVDFSIKFGLRL